MTEEEYLRYKLDMINKNSHYGLYVDDEEIDNLQRKACRDLAMIWSIDSSEIAKIIHDFMKKDIGRELNCINCPKPPIYIDPVKVKTLKERLEEMQMNATSTQEIKNVKDISFSFVSNPIKRESELTIVATTDDDTFEFVFKGEHIIQSCKKAGIFTGWEKDQKIRELEEGHKKLQEEHEKNLNYIQRKYEDSLREKHDLEKELGHWKKEAADCLRLRDAARKEKNEYYEKYVKMKTEFDLLQHKYDLEKAANEAHHEFFHKYAGKGTEIEFVHASKDFGEVSYIIVDKEKYESLKDRNGCVAIRGMLYNPVQIIDMVTELEKSNKQLLDRIKELEELKTPTIKNFANEKPSTRADILDQAKKCVCGQREQDYGTPESNFQLIADLWNDYLKKERSSIVVDAMDVSMMMALLKIARIRNGGGSGDSFVDLAGYAACGGEIWAEEQKKKDQN